ncbi:MAG: hypothetical protein K2L77_02030 [Muribaculaceae bacterium]|nr:hypothetical protein [Muribaculaceae bacterium]
MIACNTTLNMKPITTSSELEKLILHTGILPYFRNRINGFSIEEIVPEPILWSLTDGPWIWKGTLVRDWHVAYGKFFNRKAGYIALDMLTDYINLRRSQYDLRANPVESHILDILREHESLLSRELKDLSGFSRTRRPKPEISPLERMIERSAPKGARDMGFDTRIMRLQMAGYVVIADFEYKVDRHGDTYGWGVARYTTPEALYGDGIIETGGRTPEQSYMRLHNRIKAALPHVDDHLIHRLLNL